MFAELVQAARRYQQHSARANDLALLEVAKLQPLVPGFNNTVYRFEHQQQRYCLKFLKVDERQRAMREQTALKLLNSTHLAPELVYYQDDKVLPVVISEFIAGEGLGEKQLTQAQLGALIEVYRTLAAITPATLGAKLWTMWGTPAWILQTVRNGTKSLSEPTTLETAEAKNMLQNWLDSDEPARVLIPAPAIFSRGDANLANCLWDKSCIRLIDFEYSGWSDRAYDLADLVEHTQSHATNEAQWQWFIAQFALTPAEQERLLISRHLFVLFWLLKFWPRDGIPTTKFIAQLERAKIQFS